MAMWRQAMHYLGLGPDDEYDDYDQAEPRVPAAPSNRTAVSSREPAASPPRPSAGNRPRSGTAVSPPPPPRAESAEGSAVRPLPSPSGNDVAKPRPAMRPVPPATAKPHLVAPASFNQAQDVADRFKASQPVILNLQQADRDLRRRLIDFSSGLCYGLGGQMEKVANQVYLLTPANIEVSAEERRRLSDRGLHDA